MYLRVPTFPVLYSLVCIRRARCIPPKNSLLFLSQSLPPRFSIQSCSMVGNRIKLIGTEARRSGAGIYLFIIIIILLDATLFV